MQQRSQSTGTALCSAAIKNCNGKATKTVKLRIQDTSSEHSCDRIKKNNGNASKKCHLEGRQQVEDTAVM